LCDDGDLLTKTRHRDPPWCECRLVCESSLISDCLVRFTESLGYRFVATRSNWNILRTCDRALTLARRSANDDSGSVHRAADEGSQQTPTKSLGAKPNWSNPHRVTASARQRHFPRFIDTWNGSSSETNHCFQAGPSTSILRRSHDIFLCGFDNVLRFQVSFR